jgi:sortase A
MLLSRVLGGIGRFCISLGVLTLLFVAYQLWGTGILTAQAQNSLEGEFEQLLIEAEALGAENPLGATAEDGSPQDENVVDTQEAANSSAEQAAAERAEAEAAEEEAAADAAAAALAAEELARLSNLIWQPSGEPVAKIAIPAIDLSWTVVEGVDTDSLRKGPGHYPGTPLPGMAGNASVAGHRTTWGAPFNRIDELQPGDEISVRTLQGSFTYRVIAQETGKGHFIVSPDRVDVLDQGFTEHGNRLTLTACHPKFSARQRIIVVAELIGDPAPSIPRPEHLEVGAPTLASEDFGAEDVESPADEVADLPGDPDLDDGSTDSAGDPDDEAADAEPDVGDSESDDQAVVVGSTGPRPTTLFQGSEDGTFGQGLNGNKDAILPAVMWGLAATAIAATAGFIGRRWRKWPSYAVGIAPFALVLFVCFVNIDQALPSY